MSDSQTTTDKILDLLLDALQERQAQRKQVEMGALPPAESTPVAMHTPTAEANPPAQPQETVAAAAPSPAAPDTLRTPAELADLTAGFNADSSLVAPAETADPFAFEPPSYLPSINLGRMLLRLALILFALVIIVNIPFNRFGTSLATAMPDEQALVVRDGLVLKGSGDEIYVLENNRLRWITTLDAFDYYGYRWAQVNEVDDSFLANFEEGLPLYLLYRCDGSPHVYALEDGKKRWIKDIPTFEAQNFVWEEIQVISCSQLRSLPDGIPIPPDAGEPPQP